MTMNSSSPKDFDDAARSALRARSVTDPVGRRRLLLGGASTALGVGVAAATAAAAPRVAEAAPTRLRLNNRSATRWRWLGNAGWRVETGSQTLLVDPYLTRFDTGLAAGRFDATTALRVDGAEVRRHAAGADQVLVTHSHWDHFNDIPFIATEVGAKVFGSLTTYQLARAFNVPDSQLAVVKGGEVLNVDDLVVHVIASLHSRNARGAVLFPGRYDTAPTAPPGRICDLPEGDTLSYCIQESNGHRTYVMGASDFVERDLVGLAPDVAIIAVPSSDATHDYLPRLLDALDRPRTIVPVHWDNFESPLSNGPRVMDAPTAKRLEQLAADVRRISPVSRVITPNYRQPLAL